MITVVCKMCGAEFQAKQRNRKFCDGCRSTRLTLYSRNYYLKNRDRILAKYKKKPQRTVKCAICGKEFLTKSNRQKYCDACREKHVTEYRHKYYKENRERLMKYQHRYYYENRAGILEYDRKRKRILKGG